MLGVVIGIERDWFNHSHVSPLCMDGPKFKKVYQYLLINRNRFSVGINHTTNGVFDYFSLALDQGFIFRLPVTYGRSDYHS